MASTLVNCHSRLVHEIDIWFINNGVDIISLREDDVGSFVDTVDYGGIFDEEEFSSIIDYYITKKE
jgi:hypothetical protein